MSEAMDRESALRTAFELIEKMGNAEDLNKRGYKIDGWKPMTGPERADATVKLAEFLMTPEPVPVPRVRLDAPGGATIYGWHIDGSDGPPSPTLRLYAKERLYQISQDDRPVELAEVQALNALIETLEPPETP